MDENHNICAQPSNINCIDDPNQKVLGYFSVSASASKRIFIHDNFAGVLSQYNDRTCIADTIFGSPNSPIAWLGVNVWVIISHPMPPPSYRVLTRTKGCYDCTVRGTNIKPDFWEGAKQLIIDESIIDDKKSKTVYSFSGTVPVSAGC